MDKYRIMHDLSKNGRLGPSEECVGSIVQPCGRLMMLSVAKCFSQRYLFCVGVKFCAVFTLHSHCESRSLSWTGNEKNDRISFEDGAHWQLWAEQWRWRCFSICTCRRLKRDEDEASCSFLGKFHNLSWPWHSFFYIHYSLNWDQTEPMRANGVLGKI